MFRCNKFGVEIWQRLKEESYETSQWCLYMFQICCTKCWLTVSPAVFMVKPLRPSLWFPTWCMVGGKKTLILGFHLWINIAFLASTKKCACLINRGVIGSNSLRVNGQRHSEFAKSLLQICSYHGEFRIEEHPIVVLKWFKFCYNEAMIANLHFTTIAFFFFFSHSPS